MYFLFILNRPFSNTIFLKIMIIKKLSTNLISIHLHCQTVLCLYSNNSELTFLVIFDSSNAVLGMAFTHTPPLEKAIAFCTAETNFVLHSKQNKNKVISKRLKVVKKSSSYQNKNKVVQKRLKLSKWREKVVAKKRLKLSKWREKVVAKFSIKAGKIISKQNQRCLKTS